MDRLLLRNCRYMLPDHSVGAGSILIENGLIADIGACVKDSTESVAERDLHGALVMPGLVNAHGHTAMTLLRGVGGGLPLQRWLEEAIFPLEAKLASDDAAVGVAWGVLEMLAGGTTCVADMYDFPDAGGAAFEGIGFNANICCVGRCAEGRLQECIRFTRAWNGASHRGVVADICVHSEYLTDSGFCRELAAANREFRRPLHVHVSETRREHEECVARHGKTPMAYLADSGLFDFGGYAAHCVWATDDDFGIMREHGVTLVHNPTSNMKLGSGFARIAAAKAIGVNIALGTDGCASNNNLNMFEEMHLAALLHKGVAQDPTVFPASDILDMATVNGARALGRDSGEIAIGKRADLCALDLDRPHFCPAESIPDMLVYSAQASDVVLTIVDGRILYDHGSYPKIDVAKIRHAFFNAVARLKGGLSQGDR